MLPALSGFKSFQIAWRVEKHGLGAGGIRYVYGRGMETIKQSAAVIKQSRRNAQRLSYAYKKNRTGYAFVCLFVRLMHETIPSSDHCKSLQTN